MSSRVHVAGLALLAVVACRPNRPATPAATDAAATSAAPAVAPPANVVTYIARDFGFEGPAQLPAGLTTFRLDNQGKELHHLVITRLDGGRTYDSLLAALKKPGPPPEWMHLVSGPNAAEPGAGSNATIDLGPGHYAIMCFIPSADGVPHMAKGMISPLEVTAAAGPAARTIAADITITLKDYEFDLSSPLTPGNHVIQVENAGPQPHEVVIARFAPGKTIQDLVAWEKGGEKGPLPISVLGGVAPMMAKESAQFSVDLSPGDYALLCFIPDSKDGKAHLMHGMVKPVKVG
ncbi:MAG: hypothetical protein ACREL3_07395 [Gemmatimonadales bacterium]